MELKQVLQKYWGFSTFRPLQEEIITSVIEGKDTLALLPTGGGKSICFQVPTLARPGICLVITPLIALMKDQVENLNRKRIPATAIYSGMSHREIDIALDNCIYGNIKFLYLSPERLKTDIFLERVQKMKVSLVAVDEAHCISQWGYDFRPTYLEVANIRKILPKTPILALTASATFEVQKDIQAKLLFDEDARKFQRSFARNNLSYSVFYEENKKQRTLTILQKVQGTAIIYVTSRKATIEVSHYLQQNGIVANYYHGGLNHEERSKKQLAWLNNKVRVMVCTNAFGMGIDKPDVRVVIHHGITRSLEAYYQEAGRAGRDEQRAYAVMLYDKNDVQETEQSIDKKFPDLYYLRRVYQALANYLKLAIGSNIMESYDLDLVYFAETYRLKLIEVYHALRLLEMEELIQFNESFQQVSKLRFKVNNRNLYNFQVSNPTYDFFIKAILRIYGAELFSDYLIISEKQLAQHVGMPEKTVIHYLNSLKKLDVIDYLGKKETPQITFLTPRLNAKMLPIRQSMIDDLKKKDQEKLGAVVEYIQSKKRCRTIQLCEYFGEKTEQVCNLCDHCIQVNKQHINNDKEYQQQILEILQTKSFYSLEEIAKSFSEVSSHYIIKMCRTLLDQQKIIYTDNGEIKKI